MQKYAFIDRDGTIIWEPERPTDLDPHETFPLKDVGQILFIDGVIEGLRKLVDKGYKLVMVTNQTFLGTPRHPQKIFDQVMDKVFSELEKHRVHFVFVMVCPHGPDEECECRKPKIGGLEQFLKNHPADLTNSLMFGDRATDRQFAENLGVRFVRIETNKWFTVPADI